VRKGSYPPRSRLEYKAYIARVAPEQQTPPPHQNCPRPKPLSYLESAKNAEKRENAQSHSHKWSKPFIFIGLLGNMSDNRDGRQSHWTSLEAGDETAALAARRARTVAWRLRLQHFWRGRRACARFRIGPERASIEPLRQPGRTPAFEFGRISAGGQEK